MLDKIIVKRLILFLLGNNTTKEKRIK